MTHTHDTRVPLVSNWALAEVVVRRGSGGTSHFFLEKAKTTTGRSPLTRSWSIIFTHFVRCCLTPLARAALAVAPADLLCWIGP